ncbi:MAG: cyclopropane-fatty-acyl-phospholipid synthase [Minwuia sp.]|nr:cyclopropane-fatty-acyl-phospholipid synthase [Minwuia sp.]
MSTIDTMQDRKRQDTVEAMLGEIGARRRSGLLRRRGGALLWARVLQRIAGCICKGQIIFHRPDCRTLTAGWRASEDEPVAEVVLHRWRALRRLVTGGELGFAEAYLDGDWSTPDLAAFLQVVQINRAALAGQSRGLAARRLLDLLFHRRHANSRRGSRRNIAYHYDLGNDFYAPWLDSSMTYSSALFRPGDDDVSLADAQARKYRTILDMASIGPGERVLEIGCGWGGFAEVAASERGADVTGITLSTEQLRHARDRVAAVGLDDRARFSLTDYRDTSGTWDRIVSIEMFEAVGEENWPAYFGTVHDRLRPGGEAVIQVITIDDDAFPAYRRRADFIQRYIFPGGMLPSPSAFRNAAKDAGLTLAGEHFFGRSYERTLRLWQQSFERAWPEISRLDGFDDRFRRMWRFYLLFCAEGFRDGLINVALFHLKRT